MAQLLIPRGRFAEAQVVALRRARALDPLSATIGVTIGRAHAAAGEFDAALEIFAPVHAALGDLDEAFRWMDAALEARPAELVWAGRRFGYAPLRKDPRWAGVMARMSAGSNPS